MRSLPRSWSFFRTLFPGRRRRLGSARRVTHRRTSVRTLVGMEGLEGRSMLAVVNWDGGTDGKGTNFLDAVNWVGDILPGAADTAVIGTTKGSTAPITLSGTASVARIESSRSIILDDGTLVGTRFVGIDGARLVASDWNGGTLSGVTLAGDLDIQDDARAFVRNGLTLDHATVRIGSRNLYAQGEIRFEGGSQALGGTGEIIFGAGYLNGLVASGSTNRPDGDPIETFTIGPGVTIHGNTGWIGSDFPSIRVVNRGTIAADAAPTHTAELAYESSDPGGWSAHPSAAIDTSGVAGPLPQDVYTTGRATNTERGPIRYRFADLAAGVTYRVRFHLVDDACDTAGQQGMNLALNGHVVEAGLDVFAAAGGRYKALVREFDVAADDSGAILASISASPESTLLRSPAVAAIEIFSGSIRVDGVDSGAVPNGIAIRSGSTFLNEGVLSATKSDSLSLNVLGGWTNTGSITVDRGTVNLGGSFTTAGIGRLDGFRGTVNLTGSLDNTGATFRPDDTTGSVRLAGGSILGGRIETAGSARLVATGSYGFLSDVTLASDLDVSNGYIGVNGFALDHATVRIGDRDGSSSGHVDFSGAQTIAGTGDFLLGANGSNSINVSGSTWATDAGLPTGEVTIGEGITIHGKAGCIFGSTYFPTRLVNRGTIAADAAIDQGSGAAPGTIVVAPSAFTNTGTLAASGGNTLTIAPSTVAEWTNPGTLRVDGGTLNAGSLTSTSGTVTVTNGTLTVSGDYVQSGGSTTLAAGTLDPVGVVTISGGTLSGTGTVKGDLTSGARVDVGGSGVAGTLAIEGNFTQTAGGVLRLEIGGDRSDLLDVTGTASLAGTLQVGAAGGFLPPVSGIDYQVIRSGSLSGRFSADNGLTLDRYHRLSVGYGTDRVTLTSSVIPHNDPTDILLSGVTVAENSAVGTVVGTLSSVDADVGDTFTYALVAGPGDADNVFFEIVGGTLRTKAVFDAETKNAYSIRIRTTDATGAFTEKTFTIAVFDPRPTLDAAKSPVFGAVGRGTPTPGSTAGSVLVSSLVDSHGALSNFASPTGALPGIAITGTHLGGGRLWFSTDGGATWREIGAVSDTFATLLAADASTRLFFAPAAGFSGTIADVLTFRAWDRSGRFANGTTGVNTQVADPVVGVLSTLDYDTSGPFSVTLSADRRYAYVGAGSRLVVVDLRDRSRPVAVGSCVTEGTSGTATTSPDGRFLYVANWSSRLQILDVSDPTAPRSVGVLETGGAAMNVAFAADGRRAYVANGSAGLLALDVTSPSAPSILGSIDTAGYARTVSLSADGRRAFVTDSEGGFLAFDVSDPARPVRTGGIATGGFTTFAALSSDGRLAIVADFSNGFQVIDVSDPSTLARLGGVASSGAWLVRLSPNDGAIFVHSYEGGVQRLDLTDPTAPRLITVWTNYAQDMALSDDGRYAFITDAIGDFQVIDVSTPPAQAQTGSYQARAGDAATAGSCFAVVVSSDGRYAYAAQADGGLHVISMKGASGGPEFLAKFPSGGSTTGVVLSGDGRLAYLADGVAGLQIVDVSDPTKPVRLGGYDTAGSATGVTLSADGRRAYVADFASGIQIVDVSDPTKPVRLGGYDTAGQASAISLSADGRYAYVADRASGLAVIDVSNPSAPFLVGTYDTLGSARAVVAAPDGRHVYVADLNGGLLVIDVTFPAHPALVTRTATVNWARNLALAPDGSRLYVADYYGGLQVFDIGRPTAPRRIGGFDTPGYALGVSLSADGRTTYVADFQNAAFRIFDVTLGFTSFSRASDTASVSFFPPGAPVVTLVNDTGSSATDRITNDPRLSITGLGEGATVQYSVNDGTTWTASFTPVQGANRVLVRQLDATGTPSEAIVFTFTYDSIVAVPTAGLVNDSGARKFDRVTNVGTLTTSAPIATLFGTGVDDAGRPLPNGVIDPHYFYDWEPGGSRAPRVATAANGVLVGSTWLGDNGFSSWIGPDTGPWMSGPGAWYIYHTTFDLTGFDPSTVSIRGWWASDDASAAYVVNGNETWQWIWNTFATGFVEFSAPAAFVPGVNDLQFYIYNNGGPTGLRVELDGRANSIEAGATVEYSTDGGATWGTTWRSVEGANTVLVRQTDLAGNVSGIRTVTFTLDTQAPAAPVVSLLNDTGPSTSDGITRDGRLSVTAVESGATVTYSIDGGSTWSGSFRAAEGKNTVLVRQTDPAGNASAPTTLDFTLDTTGVRVLWYTQSAVADRPEIFDVTFDGLVDEATISVADFSLARAGAPDVAPTSVARRSDTQFRVTFPAQSTLGHYRLSAGPEIRDLAGNPLDQNGDGTPDTFSANVRITPVAPTVSLKHDTGSSATDLLTNDGAISVAGVAGAVNEYSTDGGKNWSRSFTPVEGVNTVVVRQVMVVEGDILFTYDDRQTFAGYGFLHGVDSGLGDGSLWVTSGWFQLTRNTWDASHLPLARYDVAAGVGPDRSSYWVGQKVVDWPYLRMVGDNLFYPAADAGSGAHPSGDGGEMVVNDGGLLFSRTSGTSSGGIQIQGFGGARYRIYATWLDYQSASNWSASAAWPFYPDPPSPLTITDSPRFVSETTTFTFTLDTSAPATPGVSLANDTGWSATDRLTKDGTLALSGIETGASVEYSIDGGSSWSKAFTAAEGINAVRLRQVDAAGNRSGSASFDFTLDTTRPALTVSTDRASLEIGQTATITFTLSKPSADFTVADVDVTGGTLTGFAGSGTVYTATFVPTLGIVGTGDVRVDASRFTDSSGNPNVAGALSPTIAIDTSKLVAPTIGLLLDSGSSATDRITNDPRLAISGLTTGTTVEYSLAGGAWTATYAPADGDVSVRVRQRFGEAASPASNEVVFFLDTTTAAPTVALVADTGRDPADGVTADGRVNVTLAERDYTVQVRRAGTSGWSTLATGTSPGGATVTLRNLQPALVQGANDLVFRVVDLAGNVSPDVPLALTYDTVAPVNPDPQLFSDSGSSSTDRVTNDYRLSGSIESDSIVEYRIPGAAWSRTFTAVPNARNVLDIRQTDRAGNVSPVGSIDFTWIPSAPTPTASLQVDTGTSTSDNVTNNGLVRVTLRGGSLLQYSTDNGATWTTTNGRPAVDVGWVSVGDAGNPPDPRDIYRHRGSVAQDYRIQRFEFTNAQYVTFLNAVDPQGSNPGLPARLVFKDFTDPIYDPLMGSTRQGGIAFNAAAANGSKYSVRANMADKPVVYVSWFDAARVANWLQNGARTYATSTAGQTAILDGAYTLTAGEYLNMIYPGRNPGATFFIPSANEWYKAAIYKGGSGSTWYWKWATQSYVDPVAVQATATGVGRLGASGASPVTTGNSANIAAQASWNGVTGNLTSVGTNGGPSYYGTYDMLGNVEEWQDLSGAQGEKNVYASNYVWAPWNSPFPQTTCNAPGNTYAEESSATLGFRLAATALVTDPLATGSFTVPVGATEGSNTVKLRQIDLAGNTSDVTSVAFTLDTTKPAAPQMKLVKDTGASAIDNVTSVGTITPAVAFEAGVKVEYRQLCSNSTQPWTASFVAQAGLNSVETRLTDAAGNSATTVFSFTLDTTAPTITSIGLPEAGNYATGETLFIRVNFSEDVFVSPYTGPAAMKASMTPFIELTIGGKKVKAAYASGSGTSTLWFSYKILATDKETSGISIANVVSLAAGNWIRDAAGNDASLGFAAKLPASLPRIRVNSP